MWGRSVAIWGVRRGRGGPPRPRRLNDARIVHRFGGPFSGFPIQKGRFIWRTPVGFVRVLPVPIEPQYGLGPPKGYTINTTLIVLLPYFIKYIKVLTISSRSESEWSKPTGVPVGTRTLS